MRSIAVVRRLASKMSLISRIGSPNSTPVQKTPPASKSQQLIIHRFSLFNL